jgi:hypothetical protein
MPSNLITINYSKELEWVVPDSQMEGVIVLLNMVGDKHYPISCDTSASPCSQSENQPSLSPQVV